MSKELSLPISAASPAAKPAAWLRNGGILLGGSALAAACAHTMLPLYFTPVPLSLQPLAVLLLGLALSPRMAAATFAAYLAEGAMGLPVFSPAVGTLGLAHLLGPTGGYLMAYPLAAGLISFLWRRTRRGYITALLAAAAGDLLILACGALWLSVWTHVPAPTVLAMSVLPFLPGDALKITAAAGMVVGFLRIRRPVA